MSIVWKHIALPAALVSAICAIVACSNSESFEDPASISLKDIVDFSIQQALDPCTLDEDGDIVYKSENGEFLKCEDKKQVHVDVDVKPLDSLDFPSDTALASSDTIPEIDLPECIDGDKRYKASNSSYVECKNGQWEPIRESWTIIPISERFLPVVQGKFIPNANFNTPFTLQPPQALNKGNVKCTFDGSEPDSTTPVFTENRTIDSTTVVRCYEFVGNEIKQKQTETYFINESIDMPVVSISVDPTYVMDYLDAEPCKPDPCSEAKFWEDVEYPTHVEYFAEGSSAKAKGFEIDAGISIMGGYSRNQQKKSVSIVMRKDYQDKKLHYPLFETRPENNKFKAFILRNNGNRFVSDYIEDAMATSLLEGTNVDYQRSRQVIVFYNGQYHGIYDMREKLNEHFVETNYGIDNNSVDFIKHVVTKIKTANGSDKDYLSMLQFVAGNDFKTNKVAYDSLKNLIDITNYMEYMAAEIYYHNGDWPHNNVRAWKSPNTPWKFIAFDIDHGFDWTWNVSGFSKNTNMLDWITNGGKNGSTCSTTKNAKCFHNILTKLLENPEFKQTFINRACYLYSTFINSDNVSKKINEINKSIDNKQIERDKKLYNRPNYKNRCGTGFDANGDCLKKWSKERDKTVRDDFRDYFKLDKDISISIVINGSGRLKLDGINITQKKQYDWNVFAGHPLQLEVECYAGAKFESWEDGSTSPNRTIAPIEDSNYIANCK
ncbi:MAG: CotH kinase family protein [Fibrobacter sp.]|nr:CotH kinase family protein [Fibrobacter sp.]